MPSREPSTTCPSPLHFTGSPTCRLGRGRKTNLLPDPGYNVAFSPTFAKNKTAGAVQLPSWTPPPKIQNVKIPSKNVVAKISCCDVQLLLSRYQH